MSIRQIFKHEIRCDGRPVCGRPGHETCPASVVIQGPVEKPGPDELPRGWTEKRWEEDDPEIKCMTWYRRRHYCPACSGRPERQEGPRPDGIGEG